MTIAWPFAGSLIAGPLCSSGHWPYTLFAHCCDLRPRFLIKQSIGTGFRAVARNGRILLCADRPVEDLPGRLVRVRLQTWHRIYLPGDAPAPHGVLLCLRDVDALGSPLYTMHLQPIAEASGELRIEVGGGMMLDFCGACNEPEA